MKHIFRIPALIATLLTLTGCVGYQLGSMLPKDIQTVYVPTFVNATSEPFLETETTRATIRAIQRDGSLRIADEDEADSVLSVRIVSYELAPLVYEQSNRSRPSQYRAITYADVVLQRRSNGEIIAMCAYATSASVAFGCLGSPDCSARLSLRRSFDGVLPASLSVELSSTVAGGGGGASFTNT